MNKEIDTLSENDKKVYHYIKEKTNGGEIQMQEPYSVTSEVLDISTSTVFRSVKKLSELGLISVVQSVDHTKSNVIFYHKQKTTEEEEAEVLEISKKLADMSMLTERFNKLLTLKDTKIQTLQEQLDSAQKEISLLNEKIRVMRQIELIYNKKFISKSDVDENTEAYLLKK